MTTSKLDFYNVPIVDYLISIGEPIESVGRNYWQHQQHDSLKINAAKNYFVWNSRAGAANSKGGVVQYLQIMHNLTLKQALNKIESDLLGKPLKPVKKTSKAYPKAFNYKVKEVFVPIEAQRYLVAERKIPNRIVRYFFQIDFISQNENKEIVFKWYKGHKVVGFDKQGTQKLTDEVKAKYKTKRDYFKYVAPTTANNTYWGFNYLYGLPKNLYFFESVIDLLSFYTLHEKELLDHADFWLISINGTAIEKVMNFVNHLKYMEESIESLNVCFDNDVAGHNALRELQKTKVCGVEFINRMPPNHEDWNDALKEV